MSKKKGSGNTMTLKDFHGGSIPTDLPLPSAPGVIARPSDRPGYDRPNPWGNPMGRPDHRSRPHSSPATRHFDDKTPFLTHAAHIGRNFDEDERKPLDGVSAPRRTISDDNIRVPSARVELKPEYGPSRQGLGGGGSGSGSGNVNSYARKVNEAGSVVGVSSQNLGGNSGGHTNVWAARKEAMGVNEPVQQAALAGQNAVSKFAHASALDKVSSGRWQSKLPAPYQGDVEAARSPERESGFQSKNFGAGGYDSVDVASGREYHDTTLARQAERGINIEDGVRVGRKELPDYERAGAPVYSELKERNPVIHMDRTQLARNDGKIGGSELHSPVPLEPSERPKLKLLPRTKPLESSEQPVPVVDHTQGYQWVSDTAHAETVNEVYGNTSPAKPSIASTESVKQAVERPKLNLKPRSQPPEHLEGNAERERNMLFGGARPRELVLKERGVDDVGINNQDLVQQSDRVEQNVPRTERVHGHAIPARHSEKTENSHLDQMTGKRYERKDHRQDSERVDMQRRNWRNECRRNNNRETERQQQQPQQPQQQVERPPSPETWRKPVEQPKPASPDAGGLRYGKAASAVELAQAFSKSVSDPKIADQFSGQKALPGRTQIPFSRLTGPTPRPQINGY
nr:uncharacterized protein LOC111989059 [Quercus suber]POF23356.1 hypothetical protein CFP56_20797 [Quercus suber]